MFLTSPRHSDESPIAADWARGRGHGRRMKVQGLTGRTYLGTSHFWDRAHPHWGPTSEAPFIQKPLEEKVFAHFRSLTNSQPTAMILDDEDPFATYLASQYQLGYLEVDPGRHPEALDEWSASIRQQLGELAVFNRAPLPNEVDHTLAGATGSSSQGNVGSSTNPRRRGSANMLFNRALRSACKGIGITAALVHLTQIVTTPPDKQEATVATLAPPILSDPLNTSDPNLISVPKCFTGLLLNGYFPFEVINSALISTNASLPGCKIRISSLPDLASSVVGSDGACTLHFEAELSCNIHASGFPTDPCQLPDTLFKFNVTVPAPVPGMKRKFEESFSDALQNCIPNALRGHFRDDSSEAAALNWCK
ncbi:hypothetical protein FA13DRAFT_1716660 [Coprinellus micaceus]|uniref:Uncharacterized protein n=1 Tax=Coprinellus micaceus TaxID=71717 RepID=A0A4Y7SIR0_COPMI|nr:hypothetical protein FA13DRAFT_1716660 [Coprinellus micaceus]